MQFWTFFYQCLTCAQLRLVNTSMFRNKLAVNKHFYILQKLLSKANLKTVTLFDFEITQIARLFFTNALFENALQLIIPILMLEELKKVQCIRIQGIQLQSII